MKIGVLALQGAFEEHLNCLKKIENIEALPIRTVQELEQLDGIILPGGESTSMRIVAKERQEQALWEKIRQLASKGFPIWGTCAGLILLAKQVMNTVNDSKPTSGTLSLLNIKVIRNYYGPQLNSFIEQIDYPKIHSSFPSIFIRAPAIDLIGEKVEVLGFSVKNGKKAVAVREGNVLGTTFHPEISDLLDFHLYFIKEFVEPYYQLK